MPALIRSALTLAFLGSGPYQWLADFYLSVAQSSIPVVVSEIIQEIEKELFTEWIRWDININKTMVL